MENRPHSPFGNRVRRQAEGVPSPGNPGLASALDAAPESSAANPDVERKRLQAAASLEGMRGDEERRGNWRKVTMGGLIAGALVLLIVGALFVHRTILASHLESARQAFVSGVKHSNSNEGRRGLFASARVLFESLARRDPGNAEVPLHLAIIELHVYEGERRKQGDQADTAELSAAQRHLAEALRLRPGYPAALYYRAIVQCFERDREGALESLRLCNDGLPDGAQASVEWKECVEGARKKIATAPEGKVVEIDVRPPPCMLPAIEATR